MRTKILILLIILCFFNSLLKAQKQDARNYTSRLYNNALIAPDTILFIYNPEFYTRKSFEKFVWFLSDSCAAHGVTAQFAANRSARADSLLQSAEFICKLSSTQVATNDNLYKIKSGEFRKNYIGGANIGDFSVLAFLKDNMDQPVWKCGCLGLISEFNRSKEQEAAKCIFIRMLHDGIIK